MPFLGVDDILFLVASTTALLWAKRSDVVESSVFSMVHLLTKDDDKARERAALAAVRCGGSPNLLLKGFDLQSEESRLAEYTRNSDPPLIEPLSMMNAEKGAMPIRESISSQFEEGPVTHEVPAVPHRHYNPQKRRPHVSLLASASEEMVSRSINSYSPAEVQALYCKIEKEGLWEAAITVSCGIELAKQQLRYLNQHNVECALRVLLNTAHPDVALAFYFRFGEDMLVADDILVALFYFCRHDAPLSLELCRLLEPFKQQWTPTIYACCLTTTARFDYKGAMQLYDQYMKRQRASQRSSMGAVHRVLAASSLLQETGLLKGDCEVRLVYLYHVIIPLVAQHDPTSAQRYVEDMLVNDPEAAPDVLLKCLHVAEIGPSLAVPYLKKLAALDDESTAPYHLDSATKGHVRTWVGAMPDVLQVAVILYKLHPSSMNMNSVLKLLVKHSRGAETATVKSSELKTAATVPPTSSHVSLLHCPLCNGPVRQSDTAAMASGRSRLLHQLLCDVPLKSELDASVLARTVTEDGTEWGLATQLLAAMLRRKCFSVVPVLATHVAKQGRWSTAAKAMTMYLSNQRSAMTKAEATLSIEASIHSGRWSSALFWMERAHAKGLSLTPDTYDLVLATSRHNSWESALRILASMHEAGATCTEKGVLDFIETTSRHGKMEEGLEALDNYGRIQWIP